MPLRSERVAAVRPQSSEISTQGTPSNREAVAAVTRACFAYGPRPVLQGVDLTLQAGEIYGLLGPNGAGKTTLMRALCGRVRLASGDVSLLGRDPARDPQARRAIGLVPQEVALYPKLTVHENLEVFARLLGLDRRATGGRVAAAIEAVRAQDVAATRVGVLSGGYQRRVNIAVALLGRPRLLLLDEPTVGVDAEARRAINEVLRDLRGAGVAILVTTHDFEQAELLCDRVGFLIGGRMAAEGGVRALLDGAFAGIQEIALTVAQKPGEGAAAVLTRLGLRPGNDGLTWTGRLRTGGDPSGLYDGLKRCGVEMREVRVREPGLESLFLMLVGAGGDAP